jgi:hypothetical protein
MHDNQWPEEKVQRKTSASVQWSVENPIILFH